MSFIKILDQFPRDFYFPWYLIDILIGSAIVGMVIFEIFRIRQHHHRKYRR